MDQTITDSNALIVAANGEEYVLINLNEGMIDKLKKDGEYLSEYLKQCLVSGSNICVYKEDTQVSSVKQSVMPAPVKKKKSISGDADGGPSAVKKAKKRLTNDEQDLFDEIIATQVMTQPMLYNPKLKSNKFAGMKAEKWKQICDKLHEDMPNAEDITIAKVKDRWIHIRDDYLKRQRLQKQGSGSGFLEVEDGQLDELLGGLKDIYELKETSSNIEDPEKGLQDMTPKNVTANIASNRKIQDKKIEDSTMKIIESSSEKFLSAIDNIKESLKTTKEDKTEDKSAKFCDCLLLELRDLNEKQFRRAQIKILQIISELKDEQ